MEEPSLNGIDPEDLKSFLPMAQVGLTILEAAMPGPNHSPEILDTIRETYSDREMLIAMMGASAYALMNLAKVLDVEPAEAVSHIRERMPAPPALS
jgi:hypothetical protein